MDGSGFASGAQTINGHLRDMGVNTGTATASLGPLGTILGTMANPMTAVALGITAVGAALGSSVSMASAWQSGMANVSKTTGLAGKDLEGLSKELLDMSTRMPTAAGDLQAIAGVAGSLGVAKENIAGFTEVAAQMAVGFEIPADVAATSAAKILTAYGKPIDASNMKALGNAVNALGDSTAATEPQILDFVNRASFLGATFGQSIPQIAALGATLISVGMDADTASTGIKSLLNTGLQDKFTGKGLNAISDLMGQTTDQMKKAFGDDLQGTMVAVADKLMTIQDPVERFNTAVAIAGTEGATALTKLAGQAGNLKTNLAAADSEWANGTSLMKTYEAQSATMDSQMQIFWNTVNKAGVELGSVLLPVVTDLIKDVTALTTAVTDSGKALYEWYGVVQDTYLAGDKNVKGSESSWIDSMLGYNINDYKPGGKYGSTWEEADQAAYAASQAATTYVDEWGNTFDTSDYKSFLVDKSKEAGTEAGAAAGEDSAKAYADANKKWIEQNGSQFEAGMTFGSDYINTNKNSPNFGKRVEGTGLWSSNQESAGFDASKYMGETKIGNFEYYLDAWNNDLITPSGNYHFDSTADMKSRFPAILQDLIGRPLSEMEIAEMKNDIPTLMKLTAKTNAEVVLENLWDVADSQRSWMNYMEQNKDLAKNAGDEIIYELYNAEQAAIRANDPTLTESLADVMKGLAEPRSVPAQIFNQALADLIDVGYVAEGHKKAMQDIALQDANAYKDALTGEMRSIKIPDISDILKSGKGIADLPDFLKNTFQPALKKSFDDQYAISKLGYDDSISQTTSWIDSIETAYTNHSTWFNSWQGELLKMYEQKQINATDFMSVWNEMASDAKKSTETVAQNVQESSGMFYGELVNQKAKWQDYINAEGGFVGPTAYYDDFRQATDPNRAASQAINEKYDVTMTGSIALDLDPTKADAAKLAFEKAITDAKPEMSLQIETQTAMDEVNRLVSYIITVNPVMSVQVQISAYADEIAAQVQATIRNAVA